MLHAGKGRGAFHKNRKPQGGTPTPAPAPVGNQLKPANIAAAYTMYTTTAVAGDVIDMDGAWFTPGAPYAWIFTKGFAAPGITINCHASQVMRFFGDTITNARTRVVGANLGADAVTGSTTDGTAHIQLQFCSLFSFFGCFCSGSAFFALYLRNCTDITARNNNFTGFRHDGIRMDEGITRYDVRGNNVADNCPQMRVSYKSDNTTPSFSTLIPGAPWITFDPDHPDGSQVYTGIIVDILFQSNLLKANVGQGQFWPDVTTATRMQTLDNTIYAAVPYAVFQSHIIDCEFSRNSVNKHPDYDPDSGNINLTIVQDSGAFRAGLNTFNAGTTTVTAPGGSAALTGAISGTSVPANPPTWSTDGATVGTIPSKIGGQAFVPYAGANFILNPPALVYDNATAQPWTAGIYIKAIPGNAKTPSASFFGYWNNVWTRWYKDGVLQQTAQGPVGCVSPVTTNGAWTADQSADSTNGVNGTWTAQSTAAVVGTVANSGWNPADNGGGFTLTGTNNKTATRTTTSVSNIRGLQSRTSGVLYFEATLDDRAFGDTDARIGLANSSAGLTSFQGNANVCHLNLNGSLDGNSTNLGTFAAQGDGTNFGFCVNFTTKKLYVRIASGWILGGDPDAAGAGIDISYLITGTNIYPWFQSTTTNDNSTINTSSFTSGWKPAVASAWS